MSPRIGSRAATAVLGILGWASPLPGQGTQPGATGPWSLSVEVLRPSLQQTAFRPREAIVSGVMFATGRYALGSGGRLVVDLPVAHGSFGATGTGFGTVPAASGTTIGSPYVGLEIGQPESGMFSELGFRLPLISAPHTPNDSSALAVGRYADLERADAFAPGLGAISALIGYGYVGARGLRVRVHGGPVGQYITARVSSSPMALWFAYGLDASYGVRGLELRAGLAGRLMMTPLVTSASGTTGHQLMLGLRLNLGGLRPGATLRVPLGGDLRRVEGAALGFDFGVPVR